MKAKSRNMGGGRRFPFPKHVWSPAGGWWASPENWKRNTAILFVVNFTLATIAYNWAEGKTVSFDIFSLLISLYSYFILFYFIVFFFVFVDLATLCKNTPTS